MTADPCAFNFIYTNYSDEKALFSNFRHLQEHLNRIGCGVGRPAVLMPAGGDFTTVDGTFDVDWDIKSDVDGVVSSANTSVLFSNVGFYLIEYQFVAAWANSAAGWASFEISSTLWSPGGNTDAPWQQADRFVVNKSAAGTMAAIHGNSHTIEITDTVDQEYIFGVNIEDTSAAFLTDVNDGSLYGEDADVAFTWLKITKLSSGTSGYVL